MFVRGYQVQDFLERHLPVVLDNPRFCLMVLGVAGAMLALYLLTRNRAAMVLCGATLLYFVPFVRF